MASRTITGSLPAWPRSVVRFQQRAAFVTATTYPARDYPASTDAAGAFQVALPVPDSGTIAYRVELPDGATADLALGAGAATTLEALLGGVGSGSTRTITGTLLAYPRSTVRFRMRAAFITASATYPAREYRAVCDGVGAFSVAVPTWSSGCVDYLINLPSGEDVPICLAAGGATTLEALLGFVAPPLAATRIVVSGDRRVTVTSDVRVTA